MGAVLAEGGAEMLFNIEDALFVRETGCEKPMQQTTLNFQSYIKELYKAHLEFASYG